ncbi:hypothetical protein ACOMHN_053999 [Nucella lapillus]
MVQGKTARMHHGQLHVRDRRPPLKAEVPVTPGGPPSQELESLVTCCTDQSEGVTCRVQRGHYTQYIAQVANIQLGEGLPDGTTVTFIDPSALVGNGHVLDPNTMELQIPTSVNIEHVILEQPIIEQLTGLQSAMGPVVATAGEGLSLAAVEGLPIMETIVDIKPPVGKGPYHCCHCDRVFNKYGQLQRHLKTHDEDKPFRCLDCSASFNVEDNLRLHVATHVAEDGSPTCPECGKKFSRVASLKAHIMMHEKEENLMCPECGDEFSVQSQLDRHMNEHRQEQAGARTYSCRQCGADYPRLSELREHMKQHYKIKASLSHRTYKRNIDRTGFNHRCKHCSKTFQKPSQLIRHERIHTGERPFKCVMCTKTFNQKGALQVHMTKHTGERSHTCQFCPSTFAQKGNLRAHIHRVHTLNTSADQSTFQCEECSCVFKKLGSLNAHISRAHSDPTTLPTEVGREEEKGVESGLILFDLDPGGDNAHLAAQDPDVREAVQAAQLHHQTSSMAGASDILQQALENSGLTGRVNGVRWHQCTYCSKEFKKPSDLVRHIRIHTHEKPYKCHQCYRAFAVKSTLTAHTKTHSGVKDYRCDECNKLFSTQGSLKVHLRLHTGAKPFDCQHCEKKFRTSAHRKSHVMSHFRDPNNPHPRPRRVLKRAARNDLLPDIPMQEPILITDTGLIQQLPKHAMFPQYLGETGSGDRPYKCAYCHRGFKKSSHLKQHIRSHTGEKPFRCSQCLHSFVSSGVLKAHARTHSGVKNYKCLVCDTAFTTNGSLKRHMSTHSEVRPFMCPYCQKTFKTSVNCKKHMKTHRHEVSIQSLQDVDQGVVEEVGVVDSEEAVATATDPDLGVSHPQGAPHGLTELSAADMGPSTLSQHDLTSTGLTDAFGATLDHTLQHTLNTQVFDQQSGFSQSFSLGGQQGFGQHNTQLQPALGDQLTQTLTSAPLTTTTTQPTPLTSMSQNQITFQTQQLDMGGLNSGLMAQSTPTSGIHHMQNILQPSEADQSVLEDSEGEDLPEVEAVEPPFTFTRIFKCGVCGKEYVKSAELKQHLATHTASNLYKCSKCESSFPTAGLLKSHARSQHSAAHLACSVCQAAFTSTAALNRHLLSHSQQVKCPVCPQVFRSLTTCKRHVKQFHGKTVVQEGVGDENLAPEQDPSVKVVEVEGEEEDVQALKKMPSDDSITVSEKILLESASEKDRISEVKDRHHTEEEAYPHAHQCHHCNKSFKKPSDLQRHTRIHTGEKPFRCHVCQRSFTVKSTLDSHMRTHKPSEKQFHCHVCGSMFSTKGSLKVHMRLHTGAKPFKCPHCHLQFRTSGHRKSHILSHFKQEAPRGKRSGGSKRQSAAAVLEQQQQQQQQQQAPPLIVFNTTEVGAAPGQGLTGQVLNIDQSLLSGQNIVPMSLTVPADNVSGQVTADGTTQILQNLVEGLQLRLTGALPQGVQLAAMETAAGPGAGAGPNLLSQTLQIDAAFLQQLQQQGNINITINPHIITTQQVQAVPNTASVTPGAVGGADPSLVQTLQLAPASLAEVAPSMMVQQPLGSMPGVGPAHLDPSLVQTSLVQQVHHPSAGATATYVTASGTDEVVNSSHNVILVEGGEASLVLPLQAGEQRILPYPSVTQVEGEEEEEEEEGEDEECGLQEGEGAGVLKEEDDLLAQAVDHHKTLLCTMCLKTFKQPSELNEHLQTEHQTAPPAGSGAEAGGGKRCSKALQYRCKECSKEFKKPSQLQRHVRIHTGERPFVCEICKKAFNQKNALMIHLQKHSGEKPHQCSYCDAAFTQRGNLKTHIKRAHHQDMVQSMNLPRAPPGDTSCGQHTVHMVGGPSGPAGEPGDAGGVEGDLYLNDMADLL